MKMINLIIGTIFFCLSFVVFADMNVPGFNGENSLKEIKVEGDDIYIPKRESEIVKETKNTEESESIFFSNKTKFKENSDQENEDTNLLSGSGGKVETKESEDEFLRSNPGHLMGQKVEGQFQSKLKEIKRYGRNSFSVQYFKNDYKYSSPGKTFDQTFRDSPKSTNPFLIQLGGNKIYAKYWGQFIAGFRFSVGYMNGLGYFKNTDGSLDPTPSDTRMLFWTLPLDLALGFEVPIGNFFKIGAAGGPSGIVIIQNRSDATPGQSERNVRRFGYGYFVEGNLKFELLGLFSDEYSRKVFNQYSMTNTFLTFTVKKVAYNNFSNSQSKFPKDKSVKIEGESFGVGITYEFY